MNVSKAHAIASAHVERTIPDATVARLALYLRALTELAEEGTGTERQKQNAKLWADAAKVTLSDPARHGSKTPASS